MKQAETLTSLEQVLKQIKYSLDLYYSFCVKEGFVLKIIPVRENIKEVTYLLNMIESQKNTEMSTYYVDKLSKQLKEFVKKLNSWEVKPLFTSEQLSKLTTYSTFLENGIVAMTQEEIDQMIEDWISNGFPDELKRLIPDEE